MELSSTCLGTEKKIYYIKLISSSKQSHRWTALLAAFSYTIQIKLKIKIKGERLPSQPNLLNRLSGENLIPSFVALMNPPFVFFIFQFLYFILTTYRVSTRRQVHYLQSKIKDSNPLATQIYWILYHLNHYGL